MKVIFLTRIYEPKIGGTYTVIKSIFDGLKKKIPVKIYDKNNNFFILIKAIKNSDICHFFGGWDFFHVFFICIAFSMKKKVIIHPLGFYEPWSLNQKRFKKKLAWFFYQKTILQKADLIHCASEMERENLLKLNNHLKTVILPYGISSIFYNNKIKNKLNKRAIFFSRIHPKKGLENLINEWIRINDKDWALDICGPCEDIIYYNSLLSILRKNKNCSIKFFKPVYDDLDKIKLFNNYDFFILPTKNENFGLAILESLACGLPVLTNYNTPWFSIKKYNAGWYIPDNKIALNRTLKKIFKLKSYNFFLKAKNAYNLSLSYHWKKISEKYIAEYSRLFN